LQNTPLFAEHPFAELSGDSLATFVNVHEIE
jgi:hypothetical protein